MLKNTKKQNKIHKRYKLKKRGGTTEQQILNLINQNLSNNVPINNVDTINVNKYLKLLIDEKINIFKNSILTNILIITNSNNAYTLKQRFDFCIQKINR